MSTTFRPAALRASISVMTIVALVQAAPAARADDAPSYCPTLRQVASLVRAKDRFASIIGRPREGNFLETTLPLPGWADCAFYGTRTYACDSQPLNTADDAERAFARILGEVGSCLRDGWAEDHTRASPGYAVMHDDRQVASITINTDQTEKNQHVVRLILFLRSR
jgi:hypothetical protein